MKFKNLIFAATQIRLTNEKIAAVLVTVEHAKEAMLAMGWVEEGEFLVLPAGRNLTMAQVHLRDTFFSVSLAH